MGIKIEVLRPKDKTYYPETLTEYNAEKDEDRIEYDDGDVKTLSLGKEKWQIIQKFNSANYSLLTAFTVLDEI